MHSHITFALGIGLAPGSSLISTVSVLISENKKQKCKNSITYRLIRTKMIYITPVTAPAPELHSGNLTRRTFK